MGNQQIEVLWAKKTELAAGVCNYRTSHVFYHFFYVLDGEGWFICDNFTFRIHKDCCVLVPPHTLHELPAEDHNLMSFLEIKFEVSSSYLNQKLANVSPLISGTEFIKCATTYIVANWMRNDPNTRRNIDYLLTTLLLTLFLESEPSESNTSVFLNTNGYNVLTQKAICYVEENYDSAFYLKNLAANLDINANYLCKVFKENTGHTIVDYLNYVRIRSALSCFYHGGGGYSEILNVALYVGFTNPTHFNRIFKRLLGVTPSAIRKFFQIERERNTQKDAARSSLYEDFVGEKRLPLNESFDALQALGKCCKTSLDNQKFKA